MVVVVRESGGGGGMREWLVETVAVHNNVDTFVFIVTTVG